MSYVRHCQTSGNCDNRPFCIIFRCDVLFTCSVIGLLKKKMSMLAGPRRKQKVINLRAKNNAWSNDNTKFGQRMLEKMGWSEGKGLGRKENGIVEHVVAKYKNDDKGLGFEERSDQWTKHEDDFNSLLANLSNGDVNKNKLHSGVSLEDKSKKSKARVHYHKFTRGKDLTRYSEKDLANIFGKKSLKNEDKIESPIKDNLKSTIEKVFTEKGSMEDYFKNKLAVIKSKNKIQISNNNEDEADYMFKGFSGINTDLDEPESHQGFGFSPFSAHNNSAECVDSKIDYTTTNDGMSKTKNKYIKIKSNEESENLVKSEHFSLYDPSNIEFHIKNDSVHNCDNNKKRKNKKKVKYQELETIDNDHIENNLVNPKYSNLSENINNLEETRTKKVKKSKRKKDIQNEDSQNFESTETENMKTNLNSSCTLGKKVMKLKNKYKQLQEEGQEDTVNILENQDECHIPQKKKKKKK